MLYWQIKLLQAISYIVAQCYASAAYAVMRCPSVRPSVLSVTFVNAVETNKHTGIFKFTIGSHTILVFPQRTLCQYSERGPPSGGVECQWGRRFSDNIWLHRVLWTVPLPSRIHSAVQRTVTSCWHWSPVSGGVCFWRETTTKCVWQEAQEANHRYAKGSRA